MDLVEGAVLAARRRSRALGGGKAHVEVAAVGAWRRQGAGGGGRVAAAARMD